MSKWIQFSKVSRLNMLPLLDNLFPSFFFFLILRWEVFRSKGCKSVHTTWMSQNSGCKCIYYNSIHIFAISVTRLFFSHLMQFPKSTSAFLQSQLFEMLDVLYLHTMCHRNLYPKSPVLVTRDAGTTTRLSSALPEDSLDPHTKQSSLLVLKILVKFFKHAQSREW